MPHVKHNSFTRNLLEKGLASQDVCEILFQKENRIATYTELFKVGMLKIAQCKLQLSWKAIYLISAPNSNLDQRANNSVEQITQRMCPAHLNYMLVKQSKFL